MVSIRSKRPFRGENNTYTACFETVGFRRAGAKFYYALGFNAIPATCGSDGATFCDAYLYSGVSWVSRCSWYPDVYLGANASANGSTPICSSGAQGSCAALTCQGGNCTVSQTTYLAGAVGYVSDTAAADYWTIDQNKVLF